MTHIRGEIEKIYEVLKKGYEEPITQTTRGYSINTGALAAATHTFALPNIPSGINGYVKKISCTCNDLTAIHNVYLTRISTPTGVTWTFFSSYFYVGDEWDTGDAWIGGDAHTWTVTIINNAAGATFTVNVYWIES